MWMAFYKSHAYVVEIGLQCGFFSPRHINFYRRFWVMLLQIFNFDLNGVDKIYDTDGSWLPGIRTYRFQYGMHLPWIKTHKYYIPRRKASLGRNVWESTEIVKISCEKVLRIFSLCRLPHVYN